DRLASPRDRVKGRSGGIAVVAGGEVWEVGTGQGVEPRESLRGAVEGAQAGERAALIGDGDHAGPHGGGEAGAADGHGSGVAKVPGIDDGYAGIWVGEERDIGQGAEGGGLR